MVSVLWTRRTSCVITIIFKATTFFLFLLIHSFYHRRAPTPGMTVDARSPPTARSVINREPEMPGRLAG